jgi:hypothetical protein
MIIRIDFQSCIHGENLIISKLGQFWFQGSVGFATTTKSILVIPNSIDLIDGVSDMFSNGGVKKFCFNAIDHSFSITFERRKRGEVFTLFKEKIIDIQKEKDILLDFDRFVDAYLSKFLLEIEKRPHSPEEELNDLKQCIADFKKISNGQIY